MHRVTLNYGFIETPDVPRDLAVLADKGIPLDPMRTSYFVGRNSFVEASRPLLPRWQEKLFIAFARIASSAGDFFKLPANRVVEAGQPRRDLKAVHIETHPVWSKNCSRRGVSEEPRGHCHVVRKVAVPLPAHLRFTLSLRNVEDLLAERGVTVSYNPIRRSMNDFGR